MPWNVPAQFRASFMTLARSLSTLRVIRSTRFDISDAARRENVISRIRRGSGTADDQMRDAVGKRVRLARAGAGDDQQRNADVKHPKSHPNRSA
jgi:hypothetical protein